jgi:drug/metabolite transporter (DMT)-like permease
MAARAHLSLVVVVVLWAGSFSVIKTLLDHGSDALDIALLRYAVAAPGFAFVLWRAGGLPGLTRRDAARLAAAGLAVVVGYHVFLNLGTQHTTSGVAALVVALAPALTLVLALALGLDRLRARHVLGLGVAFAGVAVVIGLGTGQELSLESARGPLLVLGAAISFALYNVILKPLLGRYDLLALTAASSLVGMVGLVPFVRGSTVEAVTDGSGGDLALILYLGVLATFLGYILWNVGLRGLGPTRAVTYTYGISPLAVLIGAVVLDESVTAWLVLGGALVLGGIALAQFAQDRNPRAGTPVARKGTGPEGGRLRAAAIAVSRERALFVRKTGNPGAGDPVSRVEQRTRTRPAVARPRRFVSQQGSRVGAWPPSHGES